MIYCCVQWPRCISGISCGGCSVFCPCSIRGVFRRSICHVWRTRGSHICKVRLGGCAVNLWLRHIGFQCLIKRVNCGLIILNRLWTIVACLINDYRDIIWCSTNDNLTLCRVSCGQTTNTHRRIDGPLEFDNWLRVWLICSIGIRGALCSTIRGFNSKILQAVLNLLHSYWWICWWYRGLICLLCLSIV